MQEEQKEMKKRQIDNLENLVEKHTRTERHLENLKRVINLWRRKYLW